MEITYNDIPVSNQYLPPENTQIKPVVRLKGLDTNKLYTLIMYDPNAVKGNNIHWLVTDIHYKNIETGKVILEYYGPHPPPKSGEHNYIFSLYESSKKKNNIILSERLIELNELLKKLDITGSPIYTKKFRSYIKRGSKKRYKTMQNKNKRKTKNIKTRRMKN